jgi:hypothetical protein
MLWFEHEVSPKETRVLKAWSTAGGVMERCLAHEGSNFING